MSDDEAEDEDGGLLVLRKDTKEDDDLEEEEYRELIQREVGDVKQLLWVDKEAREAVEPDTDEAESSTAGKKSKNPRAETNPEEFLAKYAGCFYSSAIRC